MNVNAVPAKHFAKPPYKAAAYSKQFSGVENREGFNCLTFLDKPGATLTSHAIAEQVAQDWNKHE